MLQQNFKKFLNDNKFFAKQNLNKQYSYLFIYLFASRCGCVPHFYPASDAFKHCHLEDLQCISDHLEEIRTTDRCSCELGCSNTVYEVEKLNENG